MEYSHNLFRRDCVQCPSVQPTCSCPAGEKCLLTIKTCEKCPDAKCVKAATGSSSQISGKSAGAIAGGVVGGLIGLGLIIGLFMWYKFRHRRRRHLQELNEVALEFGSPPSSPGHDRLSRGDAETKEPSISSTYGPSSRRSNIIPILFPFTQHTNLMGSHGRNSTVSFQSSGNRNVFELSKVSLDPEGHPIIRDSIRDSEYSVGSEQSEQANQGLRAYDVAVQGIPNLIDVTKHARKGPQQPNLQAISESEALGELPRRSLQQSSKRSSRMQHRNSFAALPDLPAEAGNLDTNGRRSDSSSHHSLNSRRSGTATATRPASRASSDNYSAHLPEEARLYQGLGLL